MQKGEKSEEPVRVFVRVRPNVEDIPQHALYAQANKRRGHNPPCIAIMDSNTLKIIPNAQCHCKDCAKRQAAEYKLDRAATGRGKKEKFFRFDRVFGGNNASQEIMYESVSDLVLNSVQGYACCLFTYGPASTGKTFTMCGPPGVASGPEVGIIPRVIEDTFQIIENTKAQDLDVFFHVEMSYVELNNNIFKNLLKKASDVLDTIERAGGSINNPTGMQEELLHGLEETDELGMVDAGKIPDLSHNTDKLAVHESPILGVFLSGHNIRIPVRHVEDAIRYYKMGNKLRKIGGVGAHDHSYRCHSVLTLHVESKLTLEDSNEAASMKIMPGISRSASRAGMSQDEMDQFSQEGFCAPDGTGEKYDIRLGKLHLVDLVGGERLSDSKVVGSAAQETQIINKSLHALGEVLHALASNAGAASASQELHVPYYNSKLTHFLKDAIGGNSKTTLICNVGPEADTYNVTLYALMFAARALKVRNWACMNRIVIEADDIGDEHELIRQLGKRIMATASTTPLKEKKNPSATTPFSRTIAAITAKPDGRSTNLNKTPTAKPPTASKWGKLKAATTAMSMMKSPTVSRSASGSTPSTRTTKKVLTVRLHSLIAQDLKYITFPLAPVLSITIGKHKIDTSRQIYRRSAARYAEEFEVPVDPADFKDGREMEIMAINVNSFGYSALIGEGKVELQSVLAPKPASSESDADSGTAIIVPLHDETPVSCGRVVMNASVLERTPDPVLLANQVKSASKKGKKSNTGGAGAGGDDDDDVSVASAGSRGSQSSMRRNSGPITPRGGRNNSGAAPMTPVLESKVPEKITSAILTVTGVICIDLPVEHGAMSRSNSASPSGTSTPLPELPEYSVTVQVGKDRRLTRKVRGKYRSKAWVPSKHRSAAAAAAGAGVAASFAVGTTASNGSSNTPGPSSTTAAAMPTAFVSFDKPEISFVVDPEQIHWESLQVTVFEGDAKSDDHPHYVGKASGQLLPLQALFNTGSETDDVAAVGAGSSVAVNGNDKKAAAAAAAAGRTDEKEFALQLKDIDHHPAGRIVLTLQMSKIKPVNDSSNATVASYPTPTLAKTPRLLKDMASSPRLNNVRVPKDFKNGWVRVNSIAGIGLNKFQLIGKHARHKHIRDLPFSPVAKQLKQSDVLGLQDPFVVVEVGDFWTSYTKVLLDQSWDCQWEKLEFSCYVTSDDATTKDMRLTVYDRRYGNTDAYIGTCIVPLVNLYAGPLKNECITEVPVLDRKGKFNGKLALSTICTGTEEGGERWSHATISAVHGYGRYDVLYDDGQEEQEVHKDFIRLVPPNLTGGGAGSTMTPLRPKRINLTTPSGPALFKPGDKVEVNNQQGRGVWLPATIVTDNEDGTYDIDSDYAMEKVNVSEAEIRAATAGSGTVSPKPGMLNRRASGKATDGDGSGAAKGRYNLRDKVLGNYKSKGTWYPGTIWKVRNHDNYCTYDIDYEMGEIEKDVPDELIKPEPTKGQGGAGSSGGPGRGMGRQVSSVGGPGMLSRRSSAQGAAAGGAAAGGGAGAGNPTTPSLRGALIRDQSTVVKAFLTPEVKASRMMSGRNLIASEMSLELEGAESTLSKFHIGDKVAVNYRGHGTFLPATIEADFQNGCYDVVYDTSNEFDYDVPEDLIRLMSEMDPTYTGPARDKFRVGDKVTANYREIGKWLPGTITRDRGSGVYDIHYNEGRNETKVAMENIKMVEANPHKPVKKTRYEVNQCVEVNTEGLGQFYPAHVVKVVGIGIYDVEYVDGTFDYDVDDSLVRPGGAYTPALPCSKPVFKVGDQVRVSCRAPEVERELRSLAAIKQRIAEERAKLAEEKENSANERDLLKKRDFEAEEEEEEFKKFMKRVDAAQDKYTTENAAFIEAKRRPKASPRSSRPVSPRGSFSIAAGTGVKPHDYDDSMFDSKEPAAVVGKVVAVEVSLGKMSARGKDREVGLADQARLAHTLGEAKADMLAHEREADEAKACRRSDNPAQEVAAFKAAFEKAEQELAAIMAAREKAIDETAALEKGKARADNEAKCYNAARRKGEFALAELVENDDDEKNRKAYRASVDDDDDDDDDAIKKPGKLKYPGALSAGKGYQKPKSALLKMALASKSTDQPYEPPPGTAKPKRFDSASSMTSDVSLVPSSTVDMDDIYNRSDSNFGDVTVDSSDPGAAGFDDIYGTPTATPQRVPSVQVDKTAADEFDFPDGSNRGKDRNGNDARRGRHAGDMDVNAVPLDDLYDAVFLAALGDEDAAPADGNEQDLGYDMYDTTGLSPAPAPATPKTKGKSGFRNDAVPTPVDSTGKKLSPRMQLKLQVASVKDAEDNLAEAIARAEKARAEFEVANAAAAKKMGEVDMVLQAIQANSRNISPESKTTPSYQDYQTASGDIDKETDRVKEFAQSKQSEVLKAENIRQQRESEADAAHALDAKKHKDDDAARKAMAHNDPQAALIAVQHARDNVDKELDALEAATKHCHEEAAAYMSARVFAEQQHAAAVEARKRGIITAIALSVVKNEQKERDLQTLREAKLAAEGADTDLDRGKEVAGMKKDELTILQEQIATALQAIAAMKASTGNGDSNSAGSSDASTGKASANGLKRASVSFAEPNGSKNSGKTSSKSKERAALQAKADNAHRARVEQEALADKTAKDREAIEDKAKAAGDRCTAEEANAEAAMENSKPTVR